MSNGAEHTQAAGAIEKVAPLFVLLAATLWGTMGIFVHGLDEAGLQTMDKVFLRSLVAVAMIAAYMLAFDRSAFKVRPRDLWCFFGTGICSMVFFNFCYFQTIMHVSMSLAAVLLYTAPAFVLVMSHFLFSESLTGRKILVLAIVFVGCVLATGALGGDLSVAPQWVLVGLGAGFGYALYSIFGRFALDKGYSSATITLYTFVFATAGSALGAHPVQDVALVASDGGLFLLILALGLVNTVLPYILYNNGLKHMDTGKAAILATIEPVAATLFGIAFFGEVPSLAGVIGMAMVIGGIVLQSLSEGRDGEAINR
ncbi:threonine and homoserine efflux system [Slackia heliotrinireducens]|uniref:Predicted permease, DMT superfamily n=1 Tax=Slackia heliotrinireducens (strain ATCC 29202 / DSM 20476 / NCTC 11029 / RHS 1) TaxID=471855 RepID=C7N379_SLAHD|nr:EamA family transporter [Slackia heliotrinireducens]ACV21600.1 predicted permease, DMT superfamily [Slackia heliotrinireducens DSM 20476]VEG99140.1 threonine and homoserine efflux system [Slackia heliotrinireducens]